MLFADGSDAQVPRRALITINGRPIFLKPTGLKLILQNPREGISVGDTEEMDFAAEGVRVHVLATVTGVCPPESDEDPTCEVTEYAATIDVTSGTSSVSIDTVGTCGS